MASFWFSMTVSAVSSWKSLGLTRLGNVVSDGPRDESDRLLGKLLNAQLPLMEDESTISTISTTRYAELPNQ
jgi:hypothetical protein